MFHCCGETRENYLSSIFQTATLSDSDDIVASTIVATVDVDKPRPQLNWTLFKLVFCALLVITIALMKTAVETVGKNNDCFIIHCQLASVQEWTLSYSYDSPSQEPLQSMFIN